MKNFARNWLSLKAKTKKISKNRLYMFRNSDNLEDREQKEECEGLLGMMIKVPAPKKDRHRDSKIKN